MRAFGAKLKELRTEKGIKQSELAEMLCVNQRTISNWENDVREPDFNMLVKIAKLFDTSTDYLLGFKDD